MKIFLQTIAVAFSMYSALPMPQFPWNEKNMKYALCAFPLVGAVIGLAESLLLLVCSRLSCPNLLRGALLCALPILLTGGIHLDGFCDTSDALASHADREKKLEILKDPRIGAFAAIRLGTFLMLAFALLTVWNGEQRMLPIFVFCFGRSLSGISICRFPLAKNTGLAHLFATNAEKQTVFCVLLALAILFGIGMVLLYSVAGIAAVTAGLLVFGSYYFVSRKEFGGITGDLAGWFLCRCELWMLAAVVAVQFIRSAL